MKKDNINIIKTDTTAVQIVGDQNDNRTPEQIERAKKRRASKIQTIRETTSRHTKRTRQNALNLFGQFLRKEGTKEPFDLNTQTMSPEMITDFIKWMAEEVTWEKRRKKDNTVYASGKYTIKTITTYVYVLNSYQSEMGLDKPVTAAVKKYLIAEKKKKNKTQKQAKAIHYNDLSYVSRQIDTSTNRGKRDKAVLLVGFFGCLRRSEIANLHIGDSDIAKAFIYFDEDDKSKGFHIVLKQHKTDTDGEPIEKYVSKNNDPYVCPVIALQDWVNALNRENIKGGHIFRRVRKDDKIIAKSNLSENSINTIVQTYFVNDPDDKEEKKYSGHSLRVGFVVSANDRDVAMPKIQTHGGWKSTAMPMHYAKQKDTKKNSPTNAF